MSLHLVPLTKPWPYVNGGHDLVEVEVVAGADEVTNLVRNGITGGRALVVHDSKRFIGIRKHPRCQSAPLGIVDDEHRHVGAIFVTQAMDFLHVAIALVSESPHVIAIRWNQ